MSEFWELWFGIGATFFTITFLFMILSILIYWRQKMDLNEAITHAREVAKEKRNDYERACALNVPSEGFCECATEHEQLAAWLTELAERREADRWIPVSERLPEDYTKVLITNEYGTVTRVVWNTWYQNEYKDARKEYKAIAWKPLPKPYESEAENGISN